MLPGGCKFQKRESGRKGSPCLLDNQKLTVVVSGINPSIGYCLDLGSREFLVHVIIYRDQPLAVFY